MRPIVYCDHILTYTLYNYTVYDIHTSITNLSLGVITQSGVF